MRQTIQDLDKKLQEATAAWLSLTLRGSYGDWHIVQVSETSVDIQECGATDTCPRTHFGSPHEAGAVLAVYLTGHIDRALAGEDEWP